MRPAAFRGEKKDILHIVEFLYLQVFLLVIIGEFGLALLKLIRSKLEENQAQYDVYVFGTFISQLEGRIMIKAIFLIPKISQF
ncbi:hypothetical protein [Lunatibacter salilacus]|nr:hypothetical protein [Lunatibacter salilacus]